MIRAGSFSTLDDDLFEMLSGRSDFCFAYISKHNTVYFIKRTCFEVVSSCSHFAAALSSFIHPVARVQTLQPNRV